MRKLIKNFSHLFLPLSVMTLLIIINLIKGADYFRITMVNGASTGISRISCSGPPSWSSCP